MLIRGLNTLQVPIKLLVLLKEDKCGNRVRTQANKTRYPTPKSPRKSLFPRDFTEKTDDIVTTGLTRRSTHNPCLDDVDRTADRRCDKPRSERCAEVRNNIILHSEFFKTQALEDVIGDKL